LIYKERPGNGGSTATDTTWPGTGY